MSYCQVHWRGLRRPHENDFGFTLKRGVSVLIYAAGMEPRDRHGDQLILGVRPCQLLSFRLGYRAVDHGAQHLRWLSLLSSA